MEASFRSRVDHVFGALSTTPASNGIIKEWSVSEHQIQKPGRPDNSEDEDAESDGEIEEYLKIASGLQEDTSTGSRTTKRTKTEEGISSNAYGLLLREDDGEDGNGADMDNNEEEEDDDEIKEMRAGVGMDPTLDFEDEEDAYDKVAIGREAAGDRMYMKEIKASSFGVNDHAALPTSLYGLKRAQRDARANHAAAAARLAEDAKDAAEKGTTHVFERSYEISNVEITTEVVPCLKVGVIDEVQQQETDADEKSEVQQQEPHADEKRETQTQKKRVRFASPDSKEDILEDELATSLDKSENNLHLIKNENDKVPDYVKHPWKYTHYTLDWSDDEDTDKNNVAAYTAMRQIQNQSHPESGRISELPKSITFVPRTKSGNKGPEQADLEVEHRAKHAVRLEVLEDDNLESSDVMEVEVPSGAGTRFQRHQRSYRAKEKREEFMEE